MNRLHFAVGLLLAKTNAVDYRCIFGPDVDGIYVEEVVDSGIAQNCGSFCECEGLMNNICHFGPDIRGKFIVEKVSSERADACDRTFCVCNTHDFVEPNTFESVLAARRAAAYDRTKKPHENGEESEGTGGNPINIDDIDINDNIPVFDDTVIGTDVTGITDGQNINGSGVTPGVIETESDGPDFLVYILIPLMVILAIIFFFVACRLYRKSKQKGKGLEEKDEPKQEFALVPR